MHESIIEETDLARLRPLLESPSALGLVCPYQKLRSSSPKPVYPCYLFYPCSPLGHHAAVAESHFQLVVVVAPLQFQGGLLAWSSQRGEQ